jgi:hypothetical protein
MQQEQALQLLESMQAQRLTPDGITYSERSACDNGVQWEQALERVGVMQARGLSPDMLTHVALMSASEDGRHWEQAPHLFGLMLTAR